MDFSDALRLVKDATPVRRAIWGRWNHIFLARPFVEVDGKPYQAVALLYRDANDAVHPFAPDTKDLLAGDWEKYETPPADHWETRSPPTDR